MFLAGTLAKTYAVDSQQFTQEDWDAVRPVVGKHKWRRLSVQRWRWLERLRQENDQQRMAAWQKLDGLHVGRRAWICDTGFPFLDPRSTRHTCSVAI